MFGISQELTEPLQTAVKYVGGLFLGEYVWEGVESEGDRFSHGIQHLAADIVRLLKLS